MTKTLCTAALSTALTTASQWRGKLADQYLDPRNARAAKKLAKLASEAPNLSDAQWESLDFESPRWSEALRQATRQVGFLYRKMSFGFFVRRLAGALSVEA
jgi:hypothetical protein